jgi:AraC-like DNA-binding protein/quercetin dioxygenase-like cupin family protein
MPRTDAVFAPPLAQRQPLPVDAESGAAVGTALGTDTALHTASALTLRRYGASPGSHDHAHFQILLGLSGTLELEVDGRGLRVPMGGGCVIAPGARHDFESARGSLCLVLDSSDPSWALCGPMSASTAHAALSPTHALARYLAQAVQQQLPLAQTQGPALLLEAWHAATKAQTAPGPAQTSSASRRRSIDWTALALWAQQHWQQDLSVADLAAQVYLSPSQLAARCRDELGLSAMAWLRGLRLAHAQHLRASGMAVATVARRTGYQSPSALTAALRRLQRPPTHD